MKYRAQLLLCISLVTSCLQAFNPDHVARVQALSAYCDEHTDDDELDLSTIPANLRDLKNLNLDGAELTELVLLGADFTGSSMRGITISCSQITRSILNNVDLGPGEEEKKSTFQTCIFFGCDVEGADVSQMQLLSCMVLGTDFDQATGNETMEVLIPEEDEDEVIAFEVDLFLILPRQIKPRYYNPDLLCAPSSLIRNSKCTVCLNGFKKNTVVAALHCGHSFCKLCVLAWLEVNPSCPLCKQDVTPVKLIGGIQQGGFYAAQWDQFRREPLPRLRSQARANKADIRRQPMRACRRSR